MFNFVRAAAYSAAAMALTGALSFADPTMAWEGDPAPMTPRYTDHAIALLEIPTPEFAEAPAPQAAVAPVPAGEHALATIAPGQQGGEPKARGLSEMVGDFMSGETEDLEHECLATAIYFESKGEPLDGQLAVAEVVINRAESGRFPSSLCGVVKQPGQFSFVRAGRLPALPRGSAHWKKAVAIAHIALQDLADSAAETALFFHARRVSPGWKRKRIATLGNHVFYR